MPRFKTTFNGYSVKFSPFIENRLAVATAQNFGIIGNGRLHVLEVSAVAVDALLPHQQQQEQQQQQQRAFKFPCFLGYNASMIISTTAGDSWRVDGDSSIRHSRRSVRLCLE
jgi:hypothetical protein